VQASFVLAMAANLLVRLFLVFQNRNIQGVFYHSMFVERSADDPNLSYCQAIRTPDADGYKDEYDDPGNIESVLCTTDLSSIPQVPQNQVNPLPGAAASALPLVPAGVAPAGGAPVLTAGTDDFTPGVLQWTPAESIGKFSYGNDVVWSPPVVRGRKAVRSWVTRGDVFLWEVP